ncbi:MAG: hypothetical protein K8Q89_02675 [Nitrosarchaeum sp.]|nr:hypothetical protein [Nitrosarchaeum sp.]
MKTIKPVIFISIFAVIVIALIYSYTNYFGPQYVLQTNYDEQNCKQGNIFEGVDRQARFSVLSTCEKAVGIVHDMKDTREDDGDYQFNLELESQYNQLLNSENKKQVQSMLVIEITSKDQQSNEMHIPKNGDKIEVYGAWVTDNPHRWNEIHPAWKITVLN